MDLNGRLPIVAAAFLTAAVLAFVSSTSSIIWGAQPNKMSTAQAPDEYGSLADKMTAIPIRAARAPQALTFSRRKGMLTLTIAHEWEQAYSGYAAEIERSADHRVALKTEIAATPADLSVSVRPEGLATGLYTLTIYGLREGSTERAAVARVPFTLTE